nr:MAG TPA: hypothetical protein [Caudoviricetes sp.]
MIKNINEMVIFDKMTYIPRIVKSNSHFSVTLYVLCTRNLSVAYRLKYGGEMSYSSYYGIRRRR